jgi:hypothetical protein
MLTYLVESSCRRRKRGPSPAGAEEGRVGGSESLVHASENGISYWLSKLGYEKPEARSGRAMTIQSRLWRTPIQRLSISAWTWAPRVCRLRPRES